MSGDSAGESEIEWGDGHGEATGAGRYDCRGYGAGLGAGTGCHDFSDYGANLCEETKLIIIEKRAEHRRALAEECGFVYCPEISVDKR